MQNNRLGFAVCGSFCTHKEVIPQLIRLKDKGYIITPIVSEIVFSTDTRFGKAEDFIKKIEEICEQKCIKSIKEAEPIGPKSLLDVLIIAPCTGNTLGKLANGITDSTVTMAAKAHLRNERPLILAPSTNDALGASAKNIGLLMNCKNVYFVPFRQDMPDFKHNSCISDFNLIEETVSSALNGKQFQPMIF
ncbi:MAG: dipicolinate synthase subunit B [Clostridia bacterium]|nr:dipicolinate synthase subunit B [Clostridia bacterium]